MIVKLVKAWNGRWHIFDSERGIVPEQPVGPFNAVAKPARRQVLTNCGEHVLVREEYETDFVIPYNTCVRCESVLYVWLDDAKTLRSNQRLPRVKV